MDILLFVAFIINIIIVFLETSVLIKLKKKLDILKYYTFLQNFLTLISSLIFVIYFLISICTDLMIPEFVRGFRYVVSVGLIVTMFIYVFLLKKNKNNNLSEDDFVCGFSPVKANFVLHYLCPFLSVVSFMFLESKIVMVQSYWTMVVAIPSCFYWILYFILSVTKLWKEPYDFSSDKSGFFDFLIVFSIPIIFILISMILWNFKL